MTVGRWEISVRRRPVEPFEPGMREWFASTLGWIALTLEKWENRGPR